MYFQEYEQKEEARIAEIKVNYLLVIDHLSNHSHRPLGIVHVEGSQKQKPSSSCALAMDFSAMVRMPLKLIQFAFPLSFSIVCSAVGFLAPTKCLSVQK